MKNILNTMANVAFLVVMISSLFSLFMYFTGKTDSPSETLLKAIFGITFAFLTRSLLKWVADKYAS